MLQIEHLHSIIDEEYGKLTVLDPYNEEGTLELFGDLTHSLAESYYYYFCRAFPKNRKFNPLFYPRQKSASDQCHKHIEYLAKIGALAATVNKGRVFEFGSALSIPSISYNKLTGNKAYAIDRNEIEIKNAKKIANKSNSNVDFIIGRVEKLVSGFNLTKNDTVIIAGPDGFLTGYLKDFVKNQDANLILSGYLSSEYTEDRTTEQAVRLMINETFLPYGYSTKIAKSEFDKDLLIFLSQKNQ